MKKPKYGPSFWSAPPMTAGYKILLPLIMLLPLAALWMQGVWSTSYAALSCGISSLLYVGLPWTNALARGRFEREYLGYRAAIEARFIQPDVTSGERDFLLGRLAKLDAQFHMLLNPEPCLQFARNLGAVGSYLARVFARY